MKRNKKDPLSHPTQYNLTLGAIRRIEKLTKVRFTGIGHADLRQIRPDQILKPTPGQVRELWTQIALIRHHMDQPHYLVMTGNKSDKKASVMGKDSDIKIVTLPPKFGLALEKRIDELRNR